MKASIDLIVAADTGDTVQLGIVPGPQGHIRGGHPTWIR